MTQSVLQLSTLAHGKPVTRRCLSLWPSVRVLTQDLCKFWPLARRSSSPKNKMGQSLPWPNTLAHGKSIPWRYIVAYHPPRLCLVLNLVNMSMLSQPALIFRDVHASRHLHKKLFCPPESDLISSITEYLQSRTAPFHHQQQRYVERMQI